MKDGIAPPRSLPHPTRALAPGCLGLLAIACSDPAPKTPDTGDPAPLGDPVVLVDYIEPMLGRERPLFVHGYPPSQAALAKVSAPADGESATADRFELYFRGVELANGYHELVDAEEQRRRFEQANRDRSAAGRAALPLDEALLDALDAATRGDIVMTPSQAQHVLKVVISDGVAKLLDDFLLADVLHEHALR